MIHPDLIPTDLLRQRVLKPMRPSSQPMKETIPDLLRPHGRDGVMSNSANSGLNVSLERIEQNCGPDARQLLLEHPALTPKGIETLSRTAPDFQRHVLERVRAGHATPLKKTAACALVYETVSFREVVSRLERALGGVRREAAFVTSQVKAHMPTLDRGPDRLLTLALVVQTARDIADRIRRLPAIDGVQSSARRGQEAGPTDPDASSNLHAASALGLLTKNARNLPLLQSEHRPTVQEQRLALDLCKQIVAVAQPAYWAARKKWGALDTQMRIRPSAATRRIITHADPDGDALVAAWLAERYLFAGERVEVLFVTRTRVLGCLRIDDCLVDVGNTFDAARYLFDHKPPALPDRNDSCAAKLVWDHLLARGERVEHLEELVLAVFALDCVKRRGEYASQANASKRLGFHAALDAAKQQGLNNASLYRHLQQWLDKAHLKQGHKPRRWVVERTLSWLCKCRAILVRYDKHARNYLGLIQFACATYWYRRLCRLCNEPVLG